MRSFFPFASRGTLRSCVRAFFQELFFRSSYASEERYANSAVICEDGRGRVRGEEGSRDELTLLFTCMACICCRTFRFVQSPMHCCVLFNVWDNGKCLVLALFIVRWLFLVQRTSNTWD